MSSEASSPFARHTHAVQRYVKLTTPRYAALHKSYLVTHPISCFGNPANARFVTVGLNPSDGEFEEKGKWPKEISHSDLATRCEQYFSEPPTHHKWFNQWIEGLGKLGTSYGNAVHLDLSPRATRPVSEFKQAWEQSLFLDMVERDLWTFFGSLELCRHAEWILMAGTVTGEYYINEFLHRYAPDYGYKLDPPFTRIPGDGKTCFHTLSGRGMSLPVFFCSVSPSAQNSELLPQLLDKNRGQILSQPTDQAGPEDVPF
jgi:hypothetical protein